MYLGQIIDTHMHLWDPAHRLAWLDQVEALNRPFLMKDYLEMAKHQPISQMVFIQSGAFPENPVLETKWVQDQADKYGGPQGIVAFAPLDSPDVDRILKA